MAIQAASAPDRVCETLQTHLDRTAPGFDWRLPDASACGIRWQRQPDGVVAAIEDVALFVASFSPRFPTHAEALRIVTEITDDRDHPRWMEFHRAELRGLDMHDRAMQRERLDHEGGGY